MNDILNNISTLDGFMSSVKVEKDALTLEDRDFPPVTLPCYNTPEEKE